MKSLINYSGNNNNVKPLNIMVVDDDTGMRMIASEWLKKAGHNVRTAVDGDDCVDNLSDDLDIIFLDIMMSGPSPREIIEEVRRKSPEASVVYITSVKLDRETPEQEMMGWVPVQEAPVRGYIEKPLTEFMLLKKVKEMIKLKERRKNNT
jgi:CheY-like chemotaxis protein